MLRTSLLLAVRQVQCRSLASSGSDLPITRVQDAKRKELSDILEKTSVKAPVQVSTDEVMDISGVPEEHQFERTARIYRPARESPQTPWENTKAWRIELDNRGRWENPLMGWSSTGDPLSNTAMALKFGSQEDAIAFCVKNNWAYELEKTHDRQIKPKNYGINFAWNKKGRISTK